MHLTTTGLIIIQIEKLFMYARLNKFLKRNGLLKESRFDIYEDPFFSLIVTIHNAESYVDRCIESLVQQSFKSIEIICVNDASTDSSMKIIQKFAAYDSRIKIINDFEHLSKLAARMKGVEQANGEYILFVDVYDFLDVNACQSIFASLKKHDIDILQFKCGVEGQGREEKQIPCAEQKPAGEKLDKEGMLDALFEKGSVSTSLFGKAIRTNIAKLANKSIKVKEPYPGEDIYHSFFIAYYAKSFQYINTHPDVGHEKWTSRIG